VMPITRDAAHIFTQTGIMKSFIQVSAAARNSIRSIMAFKP
jgi:hypothetical protein